MSKDSSDVKKVPESLGQDLEFKKLSNITGHYNFTKAALKQKEAAF